MVSIKDVAKLAGVSVSTVSRAMHNNPMISQATRDRVHEAMRQLNYSPNYSAQNLVNRQSNTVGIILPVREDHASLSNNPFFMQIIQGISDVCNQNQHMVSLATGHSEEELLTNVQTLIRSGNIKKFIFLYAKKEDPIFAHLQKEGISSVVVGQAYEKANEQVSFVDTDNYQAGYDATKFLLDKGFHNPAFAYTALDELVQADRYEGYDEAINQARLPSQLLGFSRLDDVKNEETLKAFLIDNPGVDAFVTIDDMQAIRLQKLLVSLGIAPESYGLVSFNNSLVAELASPSLTSIDIFPQELGKLAAQTLLNQVFGQRLLVEHDIIERTSTAKF